MRLLTSLLLAGLASALPASANAEMVLSQVIVDIEGHEAPRDDIEVFNSGSERLYVLAEPFEILDAGTDAETRVPLSDPGASGLLVSPQRLVLAPGERRVIRVAVTGPRPLRERVYRVAIKPVAGELTAEVDAVKILVGYDALVLVRPAQLLGTVKSERADRSLVLRNMGNASRELFDGKQCDTAGAECRALPAKRLYPGASLTQSLPYDTPVRYTSAVGKNIEALVF